MEKQILNFKWENGVKSIFPTNPMISNWLFDANSEDEAILANQVAVVAEKNGMTSNDLQHIFPAILRMLKNDSKWSGVESKTIPIPDGYFKCSCCGLIKEYTSDANFNALIRPICWRCSQNQ